MKKKINFTAFLSVLLIAVLSLTVILMPWEDRKTAQAAALKISYNDKTYSFKGQRIDTSIDGVKLPMSKDAPGLELVNPSGDERYMVSLIDVYVNGLGADYSYDEAAGDIKLSLYDTTIEMTIGDVYASVNGVQQKMPFEPIEVTYVKSGIKKILVDSEFVTKALGFKYSWKNNSSVSGSVFINTPELFSYGGKTHIFDGINWKVTYDNAKIKFTKEKCPHIDNSLYVPLKKVFSKKIGASYAYDSATKSVTMEKNGVTLKMTLGSKEAILNGEPYTLNHAPVTVKWKSNNYKCIMASVMEMSTIFNLNCSIDDTKHRADIVRQDMVYGEWSAVLPTAVEYTNIVTASAVRVDGEDIICIYTDITPDFTESSESDEIVLTFSNTLTALGDVEYTVYKDSYIFEGITIEQANPDNAVVTIYKKNNKTYTLIKEKGYVKIILSTKTGASESGNGIKIAIDCGHGNNTPGKRTPPMPFAIDIDGDGKIDIRKGEQYREHFASVGVGKYLYDALKRCNFQVYKSAFGAEDVPLVTRQSNIKAAKCDYSVCIHWNAIGDGYTFMSPEGLGVYYYSQAKYAGDSKKFASVLQRNLLKGTKQVDRGIDGQNQYAMCNCKFLGTKASVLIELAFMTNKREATTMMANSSYWKEAAEEICQGICEYTGVKYVKP